MEKKKFLNTKAFWRMSCSPCWRPAASAGVYSTAAGRTPGTPNTGLPPSARPARSKRSKRSQGVFSCPERRQVVVAHLRLVALLLPQPLYQGFFGTAEERLHGVRDVQGLQLRDEDVALDMRSAIQKKIKRFRMREIKLAVKNYIK